MQEKWIKIVIARVVEGVLMVGALVVGLWHTIASSKLEKELDEREDLIENECE